MTDDRVTELPIECPARSAGRPRASEAEARMHDLMSVAAELFVEKGYTKVSLEMIARKARVAVRTIYVKFGGKRGLFCEILRSGRDAYFASMEDLGTDQRPVRDVLIDFGMRVHDLISSPAVIKLHQMVMAEAHNDPELAQAFFEAGPQRTRTALTSYFSRPEVRAHLVALPPEQLAVHLLNCLMGDHIKRYLFGPQFPPAEVAALLVEQRVDLFLHGTLAQRP